jgi:hypothetical protein
METKKRCPNGTRKNKKTRNCEKLNNLSRKNKSNKMTELNPDLKQMIKFIQSSMKTEMNELKIEIKELKKENPKYRKKSMVEDYYQLLMDKSDKSSNKKFFEKIANNENDLEPHCFYRYYDLLATSRFIQHYKDNTGMHPRTTEMLEHIIPMINDYYQQKSSYILK